MIFFLFCFCAVVAPRCNRAFPLSGRSASDCLDLLSSLLQDRCGSFYFSLSKTVSPDVFGSPAPRSNCTTLVSADVTGASASLPALAVDIIVIIGITHLTVGYLCPLSGRADA